MSRARAGRRAQVYGAVTMNNTLCLGLFLLVIHLQDLPWTYSSEVAVTVGAAPSLMHPQTCHRTRRSCTYPGSCAHGELMSLQIGHE